MTASDLVANVKNLPPVSHAALKLVNLLEQPGISNDEVVEALRCDNVLTAKLLRACNSPYFGLAEPVASVDQAVFILGHQQILHIVLTLAFGSTMVTSMPSYTAEANALWRHSLITATAAERLMDETNIVNLEPSVAFTVGLLHDIGKLVLGQALTLDMQREIRVRMAEQQLSRPEAERLMIGTDHGEVGGCLLQNWHLPEEVVEAVSHHHQPVLEPALQFSAVAHVANALAHAANPLPEPGQLFAVADERVLAALEITPERFDNLVAVVTESNDQVDHLITMG